MFYLPSRASYQDEEKKKCNKRYLLNHSQLFLEFKIRMMITNALRILIKNPVKEIFYGKRKKK